MQYQVFIEPHPDKAYIAFVIGVPDCVAEGRTIEEAIANAKAALTERLAQGEIVTIEMTSTDSTGSENPWLDNFGRFKDDPTFDDFSAEIEADRSASAENEPSE